MKNTVRQRGKPIKKVVKRTTTADFKMMDLGWSIEPNDCSDGRTDLYILKLQIPDSDNTEYEFTLAEVKVFQERLAAMTVILKRRNKQ